MGGWSCGNRRYRGGCGESPPGFLGSSDFRSLSLSLPTPNTLAQNPRFFFGSSVAVSSGAFGGPALTVPPAGGVGCCASCPGWRRDTDWFCRYGRPVRVLAENARHSIEERRRFVQWADVG